MFELILFHKHPQVCNISCKHTRIIKHTNICCDQHLHKLCRCHCRQRQQKRTKTIDGSKSNFEIKSSCSRDFAIKFMANESARVAAPVRERAFKRTLSFSISLFLSGAAWVVTVARWLRFVFALQLLSSCPPKWFTARINQIS